MTDNYGSDHETHDHEIEQHTEEAYGDQPPVDDFDDAHTGDTATVEETTEAGSESAVEESVAVKKSPKFIFIGALVGGLLLVASLAYFQFLSPSLNASSRVSAQTKMVPPSVKPVEKASASPTTPVLLASSNAPQTETTAKVDVSDIANLKAQANGNSPVAASQALPSVVATAPVAPPQTPSAPISTVPLVPPSAAGNSTAPAPQTGPTALPSSTVVVPPPASSTLVTSVAQAPQIPGLPQVPGSPMPSNPTNTWPVPASPVVMGSKPIPASPQPPVAGQPVLVPPAPLSEGNADVRIATLTTRVGDLQKALDQAAQQISHLNSSVMTIQNTAPNTNIINPVLEDRINRLEQTLAKLENSNGQVEVGDANHGETTTKHTTHHVVHSSKSHRSGKKPVPQIHTVKNTRSKWVLRAATPDEAWVAKSEDSSELRHVKVGDTLPGVGRIKSISQSGDDWVIKGSKGTLR